MSIGEQAVDYAQVAAKEKLTELQLRIRQLLEQVEQITKEQAYQRVRMVDVYLPLDILIMCVCALCRCARSTFGRSVIVPTLAFCGGLLDRVLY